MNRRRYLKVSLWGGGAECKLGIQEEDWGERDLIINCLGPLVSTLKGG